MGEKVEREVDHLILVLFLIVIVLVVIFAVQNSGTISVEFMTWSIETSKVIVVLAAMMLGALLTAVYGAIRRVQHLIRIRELRKEINESQAKVRRMEQERDAAIDKLSQQVAATRKAEAKLRELAKLQDLEGQENRDSGRDGQGQVDTGEGQQAPGEKQGETEEPGSAAIEGTITDDNKEVVDSIDSDEVAEDEREGEQSPTQGW